MFLKNKYFIPRQKVDLPWSDLSFVKSVVAPRPQEKSFVSRLEQTFVQQYGADSAFGVSSGTSGIYLALKSLGLPAGANVILSALNYHSIPKLVRQMGFNPVYADVDERTWLVSPESLEKAIRRYKPVKAVIVTHLFGLFPEIHKIMDICEHHDIPVIEDCAHSVFDGPDNRFLGTYGKAAVLSFSTTKPLNLSGGGMVLSNDLGLTKVIKANYASFKAPPHLDLLKSTMMTIFQALMTSDTGFPVLAYPPIRVAVDVLNLDVELRKFRIRHRQNVAVVEQRLHEIQGYWALTKMSRLRADNEWKKEMTQILAHQLENRFTFPFIDKKRTPALLFFPLFFEEPTKAMKYLLRKGVDTKMNYMTDCSNGECGTAARFSGGMVCLPMHPSITRDKFLYMVDVVKGMK